MERVKRDWIRTISAVAVLMGSLMVLSGLFPTLPGGLRSGNRRQCGSRVGAFQKEVQEQSKKLVMEPPRCTSCWATRIGAPLAYEFLSNV